MKLTSVTTLFTLSALASGATAQPSNGKNPVAPQSNPTGDAFLKQLIETAPLGLNISNVRQLQTVVTTSAAGVVGEIITLPFAIPPGFLECNGQAVSRDEYPELFAAIGTGYGLGTEINTFKVPDYRGYFLRGWDHGAGIDPDRGTRTNRGDGVMGDNIGTKQADALQNIHGRIDKIRLKLNQDTGASGAFVKEQGIWSGDANAGGMYTANFIFDASLVARTSTETRSKNVYVVFAIRAKPISDTSQSVKTLQLCDQAGQNCVKPSDIVALAQKADQTSVSVAALSNDVSRHQQSISSIQNEVGNNKKTIQVLSKENTLLKQNMTQATGILKQTRDELDLTKKELSLTQTKLELTTSEILTIKTQYEIASKRLSDLESVYQIIDQSKAKDIQSTQSEQSQQLKTQDLWLTIITIIVGSYALANLYLFFKNTHPVTTIYAETNDPDAERNTK